MKITEDTIDWALAKLTEFAGWRGYPQHPGDLRGRARSFLRLVHDRPTGDLMAEACARKGIAFDPEEWGRRTGIDPAQSDAEWILDTIREGGDFFPLPVEMRRAYSAVLPPASILGGVHTQEE